MQVERGYNWTLVRIIPQQEFVKRFTTIYITLRTDSECGASVEETLNRIREAACTVNDQIQEELLELESRFPNPSSVLDGEATELSLVQLHQAALLASSGRPPMEADQGHRPSIGVESAMEGNSNMKRSTISIAHTPRGRHRIVKDVRRQGVSARGRKLLRDQGKARKQVEPTRRRSQRIARMQQASNDE